MPVLPIIPFADPQLRRMSEPVGAFDDTLRQLAADLLATLHSTSARALAAPQVGVPLRLFVMADAAEDGTPAPRICVNPLVLSRSDAQVISVEPSLSFDGAVVYVARPDWVILRWQGLDGRDETALPPGAEAVNAQRKIDLLDGRSNADLPDCAPARQKDAG